MGGQLPALYFNREKQMSSLTHEIIFPYVLQYVQERIYAICVHWNVSLSPQNCIIPSYRASGLNFSCTDWCIINGDVLSARDWASRPSKTLASCWERNQSSAASEVRFMCLHPFGGFSEFTVCRAARSPVWWYTWKFASRLVHPWLMAES